MKKKNIIIAAVCILAVAAIALILVYGLNAGNVSNGDGGQSPTQTGGDPSTNEGNDHVTGDKQLTVTGDKQLTIFTFDKELELIIRQYAKMHPEFDYKIVCRENDMDFFYDLNHSLQNREGDKADIYCVPASFAQWYIKGDYSGYACTYKELGIDVDAGIKEAGIPQAIVEAGTSPEGEVIALPYKKNVNIFMYRRSIAREVWGTDDPEKIAGIIGEGTGKWDKYLEAAQTLKEHGCYMAADYKALSSLIETDIPNELLSFENSDVDPKWEEYMDVTKNMFDKGFVDDNQPWTEEWLNALNGKGDKPVFGLITQDHHISEISVFLENTGDWAACLPPISMDTGFYTGFEDRDYYTGILVNKDSPNKDAIGPLIQWITLDSSETGLQYRLANGMLYGGIDNDSGIDIGVLQKYGGKRSVVSGTVMKKINNTPAVLNGQNINSVIYEALNMPAGKHHIPGLDLFRYWVSETEAYIRGEKDKKTAVADFKKAAEDGSLKAIYTKSGLSYTADGKLYSLVGKGELNVYSYDQEIVYLIEEYIRRNPAFNYKVNWIHYALIDDYCTLSAINRNIQNSDGEVVDIYCVPDAYSNVMIKGKFSKHASTYKELGIDVDAALKTADIPKYMIDAGTNPDGELIALPCMTGANVFMYRRSIAKDVWGTDDPDKIAGILGSGTEKWDSFLEAAKTLKEHGCYIVPGYNDMAGMIDNSIYDGFSMKSDEYRIDPKWEEFMDISKLMKDDEYLMDIRYWSDEWIDALNGKGSKPVFGLVLPYEYIDFLSDNDRYLKGTYGDWAICVPPFKTYTPFYTGIMVNKNSPNKDALGPLIEWLTLDSSKAGMQGSLVNGDLFEEDSRILEQFGRHKTAVSGTVLRSTECKLDFLGGQDINPVIYDALNTPTGINYFASLPMSVFSGWTEETRAYANGEKEKAAAIADFKEGVKSTKSQYKKIFDDYEMPNMLP